RAPLPATLNSSTPPLPPVCTYRNRPPIPAAVAASTAPGPVAVLPGRLSCPLGGEAIRLSDGGPAVDANREDPTGMTQHVAACPVATRWSRVTVPLEASWKVDTAFVPASAITRWPNWSKEIANGTVPGSPLTAGVADRRPLAPTPNTSMSLPLPLVVTTSWEPSGVKASCPGVGVTGRGGGGNGGAAAGPRRRARWEPGSGTRAAPPTTR